MNAEKPPKILIVDDEPSISLCLSEFIQISGMEVFVASDGVQGTDAATSLKPDLIIMDINMPRMNGFEAAQRIIAAMPNAKIMFLTGYGGTEAVLQAYHCGASDFMTKPFAVPEIRERIQAVLSGKTHNRNFITKGYPSVSNLLDQVITQSLERSGPRQTSNFLIAQYGTAIAEIVGGFCHDLNNSLCAAQMALEIQTRKGPFEIDPARVIADAEESIQTLHQFVRQFYLVDDSAPAMVDKATIQSALTKMLRTLPSNIVLEISVAPDFPAGLSLPELVLRHLIVPLVSNAQDALSANTQPLKTIAVEFSFPHDASGIGMTVSDNGPGWNSEIRSPLWTALRRGVRFSTKGEQRGHGLSNIYRLATKLGGNLKLGDAPGGGATVEIFLPKRILWSTTPN